MQTAPDERPDDARDDPKPAKKPANAAPDAVKDPNEKTEGKPGLGGGASNDGDADPGGG